MTETNNYHKVETNKNTSEVNVSKKTGLNGVGAKWYLEPEETFKEPQGKSKPTTEPKKKEQHRLESNALQLKTPTRA